MSSSRCHDADSPLAQIVRREFGTRFGAEPQHLVRAPGRINLIGEHTDYNGGYVLPMAIDRATWIALRSRDDGEVCLHSLDQREDARFSIASIQKEATSWREYPKGVAWALLEAGHNLCGWEGVSTCDVPMGAGLSSSASFELATARAFEAVSDFAWDAPRMALLSQRAENEWVGVNCGVMDQMISAVGEEGHAVLIDCRDLSTRAAPLPSATRVVVMDTSTRRGLVESAYNERRAQCEAAARFFGAASLREVSLDLFEANGGRLAEITRRRARHVLTENVRTLQAASVMGRDDSEELGRLMNQSHESLRDDFDVSNAELNAMVEIARASAGCFGARMTGGGFGGCAIALVRESAVDDFIAEVSGRYQARTTLSPKLYSCRATPGAQRLF